jgi:hypothetical protein
LGCAARRNFRALAAHYTGLPEDWQRDPGKNTLLGAASGNLRVGLFENERLGERRFRTVLFDCHFCIPFAPRDQLHPGRGDDALPGRSASSGMFFILRAPSRQIKPRISVDGDIPSS